MIANTPKNLLAHEMVVARAHQNQLCNKRREGQISEIRGKGSINEPTASENIEGRDFKKAGSVRGGSGFFGRPCYSSATFKTRSIILIGL